MKKSNLSYESFIALLLSLVVAVVIVTLVIYSEPICEEIEDPSYVVIEIQEDTQGRVLSKRVYDEESKLTYIYTYNYKYEDGLIFCESAYVTIVDSEGNILSSSVE